MRVLATFILSTTIVWSFCCSAGRAENEDLKEWQEQISAGKFAGVEKQIETARLTALEKNDYVRVSAIEELQNEIKRRKATAGGGKADSATTLNEAIRVQMIMLQTMVEKFGKQHHGKYPVVLNPEFKSYFPMITINKSTSTAPFYNPFTKKQEWFAIKPLTNIDEAESEETLPRGQIIYCPIKNGATYAIIAGGADGKLIRNKDGQNLVMTRK